MDTTTSYPVLAERLATVADDVVAARWSAPSPCAGWSAADVVDHLVTTQRDFLLRHAVDTGPAPDVHADPAGAWRAHATGVADLLARPDIAGAAIDGFFGPSTIGATLDEFYGFDMIVHRWDVARATGADAGLTSAELDRVEANVEAWGDHLYAEGICRPPVEVGPSASRQVRLLARLGRAPR